MIIQKTKREIVKSHLDEIIIQRKIAYYTNYSSLEQKLFEATPEWTSDLENLTAFHNTLKINGGQGNEAIESGL